jgi:hypothetical protein
VLGAGKPFRASAVVPLCRAAAGLQMRWVVRRVVRLLFGACLNPSLWRRFWVRSLSNGSNLRRLPRKMEAATGIISAARVWAAEAETEQQHTGQAAIKKSADVRLGAAMRRTESVLKHQLHGRPHGLCLYISGVRLLGL